MFHLTLEARGVEGRGRARRRVQRRGRGLSGRRARAGRARATTAVAALVVAPEEGGIVCFSLRGQQAHGLPERVPRRRVEEELGPAVVLEDHF
jgi:hypothetical protein